MAIAASSCVERVGSPLTSIDGDELVVHSIISPDEAVQAAVSVSHLTGISFPESAEIELMGTGLQGSSLRFSYKNSTNRYILRNQQFRPTVGGEYELRAFVPDSDIDTIFSRTVIPAEINIAKAEFSNTEIATVNNAHDYFFDLTIQLEEPEVMPAWLHIIPTYKTNISDDFQKFEIEEPTVEKNAVKQFYLEEGIFVDMTKLSGNEITIRVSTLIPVKPGALIKNIFFETRSTTKDYYQYLQTRAKQTQQEDGGFSAPITNFTNIDNGLGIFAGYSSSTHSIKF